MNTKIIIALLIGLVSIGCHGVVVDFSTSVGHAPYIPSIQTKNDILTNAIQDTITDYGEYITLLGLILIVTFVIFMVNDAVIYGLFFRKNFSWNFIIKKVFKIHIISYSLGVSLDVIRIFIFGVLVHFFVNSIAVNLNTGYGFALRDSMRIRIGLIDDLCFTVIIIFFLLLKKKLIQNSFLISAKKSLLIAFLSSIITALLVLVAFLGLLWLNSTYG